MAATRAVDRSQRAPSSPWGWIGMVAVLLVVAWMALPQLRITALGLVSEAQAGVSSSGTKSDGIYYRGQPLESFSLKGIGVIVVPDGYQPVRVKASHQLEVIANEGIINTGALTGGEAVYIENKLKYAKSFEPSGYQIRSALSFPLKGKGKKAVIEMEGHSAVYGMISPWDPSSVFLFELVN